MLHELSKIMSHELRFSPDGEVLAVAYVDGRVALWSVHDGAQLRIADTGAQEIYTVDWSPDGQILATAGRESDIILWNAEDLSVLARLAAPEWVIRVKFSPDGTRLLSAGGEAGLGKRHRTVLVWGVP
jgi:WD40 repeat protein